MNKSKYQPNISVLEQVQDILSHTDVPLPTSDQESDTDTINDNNDNLSDPYAPVIAAFRRSNNIICDACGSRGHHASKCFKRGLEFLPRDVQRRITAYKAKFGNTPSSDKSTNPHKSYHALTPPDHRDSQ